MNSYENPGIIIQARMGSKRLPGKVMKEIDNKPLIFYLIKRIQLSSIKNIYLATSEFEENDLIINYINENFPEVIVFRGSEHNVFSRYFEVANKYNLSTIIRLTADCPLIDFRIINMMYEKFISFNPKIDYFSNTTPVEKRTYPDGMDVEIFSFEALRKANMLNLTDTELEHVTHCFLNSRHNFKINKIDFKTNLSYLHLSVDYQHNFDLVEKIIKKLIVYKLDASLEEILNILNHEKL